MGILWSHRCGVELRAALRHPCTLTRKQLQTKKETRKKKKKKRHLKQPTRHPSQQQWTLLFISVSYLQRNHTTTTKRRRVQKNQPGRSGERRSLYRRGQWRGNSPSGGTRSVLYPVSTPPSSLSFLLWLFFILAPISFMLQSIKYLSYL